MSRIALTLVLTAALASPAAAAPRGVMLVDSAAPQPNAAAAKLVYMNGPLLQHTKVFMVFYAPGYPYKEQLVSFYKAVLQSSYIDMLQEYDTTNYKIRRGSYLGLYEDTNTNPATVKQVNPETYLVGLLTAKKIPAPDADTLYMLYFPNKIDPTDPMGAASCISNGQFCAYHNSVSFGGQSVYYGVIPDTVTGGGCVGGCGPSGFGGLSSVSSHEFVETMTDPDVTSAGWYDNANGEIGDICNGKPACLDGSANPCASTTFTVQLEWSNQKKACIASNPMYSVNDFSVALNPATALTVPVGGMTTAALTLTKTSGMADNAMVTASGLPTGVTASFSPTSVTTAGGTSMMTVSAGANAMLGAATFTVTVTGLTASHTQDVQMMIASPPDMATSPDLADPTGGGNGGGNGNGGGMAMAMAMATVAARAASATTAAARLAAPPASVARGPSPPCCSWRWPSAAVASSSFRPPLRRPGRCCGCGHVCQPQMLFHPAARKWFPNSC